jgi:hypothetical protein
MTDAIVYQCVLVRVLRHGILRSGSRSSPFFTRAQPSLEVLVGAGVPLRPWARMPARARPCSDLVTTTRSLSTRTACSASAVIIWAGPDKGLVAQCLPEPVT